jgi:hypothetical protein
MLICIRKSVQVENLPELMWEYRWYSQSFWTFSMTRSASSITRKRRCFSVKPEVDCKWSTSRPAVVTIISTRLWYPFTAPAHISSVYSFNLTTASAHKLTTIVLWIFFFCILLLNPSSGLSTTKFLAALHRTCIFNVLLTVYHRDIIS